MADVTVGGRACPRSVLRVGAVAALAFVWISLTAARQLRADTRDEHWRWMNTRDGITSWFSERAQQPLAVFRAQTVLEADLWTALAVLEDVDRACEWTSRCAEMRRLGARSQHAMTVYARTHAPWPVRDRDVVVRVQVSFVAAGELLVTINAVPQQTDRPAAGTVRMPRFLAHYRFRALAERRTQVEYQIDVDPGGTLPDWLKRVIARDLTHDTLADLRKRTLWALARGEYSTRSRGLAATAQAQGFTAGL